MGTKTARKVTAAKTSAPANSEAGQTVQVHEEQLHATRSAVKVGEARVRKEVITEHKTIEVPVTREELVIERRAVSGKAATSAIRDGEDVIRIPLTEEQVHLEKEIVVVEEVSIGKRKVTSSEAVSGTARKEEVKVVTDGDVTITGDKKK